MVGLYRLTMKWGFTVRANPREGRRRNRAIMWGACFYCSSVPYSARGPSWKLAKEHGQNYGERYVPQSVRGEVPAS
jgi:fumarate reductase subunit C